MRVEKRNIPIFCIVIISILLFIEFIFYLSCNKLNNFTFRAMFHITLILLLISISAKLIMSFSRQLKFSIFLYIVIASTILFILNIIISEEANKIFEFYSPDIIFNNYSALSILFISAIDYIIALIIANYILKDMKYPWWNRSKEHPLSSPNWESILHILCDNDSDPIRLTQESLETPGRKDIFLISLVITAVIFISAIALDYIAFPRIPIALKDNSNIKDVISLSNNLTAFLALIAAGISIIFTYQQLQAKVRAESRQNWINEVRKEVSGIISVLTKSIEIRAIMYDGEISKFRSRLELYLNPSELDHRLLMLLIRACTAPHLQLTHDVEFAKMYCSDNTQCMESRNKKILLDLVYSYSRPSIMNSRIEYISKHREVLISFIYKLSYSLLKREWERVRNTQ